MRPPRLLELRFVISMAMPSCRTFALLPFLCTRWIKKAAQLIPQPILRDCLAVVSGIPLFGPVRNELLHQLPRLNTLYWVLGDRFIVMVIGNRWGERYPDAEQEALYQRQLPLSPD